jgi:hypothetical protein
VPSTTEPAPAPPPVIVAPPPVTTEVPPPTPGYVPAPLRPDPDTAFLTELSDDGILISSTPLAINGAHDVCAYIAEGHTPEQAAEGSIRNNPSLTPANARAYVLAAIHAYCP